MKPRLFHPKPLAGTFAGGGVNSGDEIWRIRNTWQSENIVSSFGRVVSTGHYPKDPHIFMPGGRIFIPPIETETFTLSTGTAAKFQADSRLRGLWARVFERVQFKDVNFDERLLTPRTR